MSFLTKVVQFQHFVSLLIFVKIGGGEGERDGEGGTGGGGGRRGDWVTLTLLML